MSFSQFNINQSQADPISDNKSKDNTKFPLKMLSPSEIKPPTLNSSLLANLQQEQLLASAKKKSIGHFNFSSIGANNDVKPNQSEPLYSGNVYLRQSSQRNNTLISPQKQNNLSDKQFIVNKFISQITKRIFSISSKQHSHLITKLAQEQYILFQVNRLNPDFLKKYDYYHLWSCFVSLMMVLSFILLPLQISFKIDQLLYIHIFIFIIFVTDILVEASKPILQFENVITNKWLIIQNYIHQYFILDVLKIVLFILILEIQNNLLVNIFLQISFFIVSYKKQSLFLNEICQLINSEFLQQFLILIYFLLLSHIIACIWHQVGISTEDQSWLNDYLDYDNTTRYLLSLQWTIQNLLTIDQSYRLLNKIEILISIIINIISIFSIGYIVKSIYRNTKASSISKKNQQILKDINHFFSAFEISTQLRVRIQKFLNNYFQNSRLSEQQENYNFIHLLPQQLQDDLIYEQRMKEIKFTKSLKKFSQNTLQSLSQIMELKTFKPSEDIIEQSDIQDKSLYIIQSGLIQIYNSQFSKQQNYQILTKHDSFGEWSFYTGQQRMASAKSIGFSKVYKIDQMEFLKIIKTNPKDQEMYHFIKHQLIFSNQLQYANLQCYGCLKVDHLLRNCPILKYQPDIEKLILQNNFNTQDRILYFRNSKEKRKIITRTFQNMSIIKESLKYFQQKNKLKNYDSSDVDSDSDSQSNQDLYKGTLDSISEQGKTTTQNQILKDIELESDSQMKSSQNQQQVVRLVVPSLSDGLNQNNLLKKKKQSTSNPKIMSLQNNNFISDQGYIVENEDRIPEIKTMLQHRQTIQNQDQEQDKLYQIKEENDTDTLQLSNPEQTSPTVQAKNFSLKSQRISNFSSALSSIPRITSLPQRFSQLQVSPSRVQPIKSLQQFNHMSMLDLSQFEREDQFEVKYNYQIFFPYFNCDYVIHRYNQFLLSSINYRYQFKYSLFHKVQQRFLK